MTDPLEDYARARRRAESLRREADRAEGALDQLRAELQENFGLESLAQVPVEIEACRTAEAHWQAKFEGLLAELLEKYPQLVEK